MAKYDFIVIGGGSAGLTGASFGAQLGAKTALIEKHRIGGDCTWTGCVPSKTLRKVAIVAHQMRTAERFGLTAIEPRINFHAVMDHVRQTIQDIYQEESPERLRTDGIDVFQGSARFLDTHTIDVDGQRLSGRNFLIASGAHPFIPTIAGLDLVQYDTYETIWNMDQLPARMIILGGGPIGCEMAQALGRLGSRVTLVEGGDRLLSRDDLRSSQVIEKTFIEEGVALHLNAKVKRVWQDQTGIHVNIGDGEVAGDALLVAVGRKPNVSGLDLEEAGIKFSSNGIGVDMNLRTNQKHILAAGDCTGGYQFTHYAGWQAAIAARNALLPGHSKGTTDLVPWTTFTDPEVAQVGLTEAQARAKYGDGVMTRDWPMSKVDRARAEVDTAGFLKIIHKKDGTLLGVSIVAARAGEMINEWVIAMDRGLRAGDISSAIHVYPSYSVANMQASAAIRIDQLLNGASGRVIRGLARLLG
jgi:pyruvate/2-oxoglutarate dehydrogenase complex dihydrolipoamide dehydrogenase (E3) component